MRDESGSATAEFVLVSALLTLVTVAVLQLGLALLVRNTLVDAAAEGARFGALADNGPADGVRRTADLISAALGPRYTHDVRSGTGSYLGQPALIVTVTAPLPLAGLLGPTVLEVSGHAPVETLR